MRYLLIALFVLFCVSPSYAQEMERKPGPLMVLRQPIKMDYGASPLLMVVFNHDTHKSYGCRLCHHKSPAGGPLYAPCTTKGCHSIPGARERGKDSMFMAYHAPTKNRSCYGCHTKVAPEHAGFVGCYPCHGTLNDVSKTTAAR